MASKRTYEGSDLISSDDGMSLNLPYPKLQFEL